MTKANPQAALRDLARAVLEIRKAGDGFNGADVAAAKALAQRLAPDVVDVSLALTLGGLMACSASPGASAKVWPWLVLDGETGAHETPLRRFRTEAHASAWIGLQPDQAKVTRGGYSLEGPADA